jgi:predicted restriction endonuclease
MLYDYRCQMTGEKVGESYSAMVVEAHHIIPFIESLNNDTTNIIILSPSYHRIIHKVKPTFDRKQLAFCFPNGLVEKVKLNKHLSRP